MKTPKIYIRDSGILHSLFQLPNMETIFSHPIIGASWEGFVVENIINQIDVRWDYTYYRTATQAEIDLVLRTPDNEIWAVEIKRTMAPKLTRGFYDACKDVKATHKWVVNANNDRYPLPNDVEVIGMVEFLQILHAKAKAM